MVEPFAIAGAVVATAGFLLLGEVIVRHSAGTFAPMWHGPFGSFLLGIGLIMLAIGQPDRTLWYIFAAVIVVPGGFVLSFVLGVRRFTHAPFAAVAQQVAAGALQPQDGGGEDDDGASSITWRRTRGGRGVGSRSRRRGTSLIERNRKRNKRRRRRRRRR